MFAGMRSLLAAWVLLEPAASLMLFAAAVLLFGMTLMRLRHEPQYQTSLLTPFVLASLQGLIFIGITGVLYFLLRTSFNLYKPQIDALARGEAYLAEVKKAREKWGAPFTQTDLSVTQTVDHVVVQEVIGQDGRTRYLNQTVTEILQQENIIGFQGMVNIKRADQRLNTYTLDAVYQYDVVNYSDSEVNANFRFPIEINRTYENLSVLMDGKELAASRRIENGILAWNITMSPRQQTNIIISYRTRGMEYFSYNIPSQRVIHNYSMDITVDTSNIYLIEQPETTAIQTTGGPVGKSYHETWTIDNAILAPKVGILFKTIVVPDIDHQRVLSLAQYAPRGLMLLMVLILFTHLIFSLSVDSLRLSLIAAVYSAQFILLLALDLVTIHGLIVLPLLELFSLYLYFLAVRPFPSLPRGLILFSGTLFSLIYPYAGFISDTQARTSFDSLTQALIILYIFILAFYIRVRKPRD